MLTEDGPTSNKPSSSMTSSSRETDHVGLDILWCRPVLIFNNFIQFDPINIVITSQILEKLASNTNKK